LEKESVELEDKISLEKRKEQLLLKIKEKLV
jgi:hypothetical protein